MPKYKVKTDKGTFAVELDKEPSSLDELNSLVTTHLSGQVQAAPKSRDLAAEHAANRAQSDPTFGQALGQFGRGVVAGAMELPGKLLESGKGLYQMANQEVQQDPNFGPMKALGKAGLAMAEGIPAYLGEAAGRFIYDSPENVGKLVGENALPLVAGRALKGVSRAAGKSSELLRESAVKQYSKVLGPTTKENKLITERVVPELLKRKVRALSRPGLEAKAEASAASANEALEAAYAALPQDASVEFGPVLRQIEKAKDNLVVKGTNEIVREDLYRALEKVQQKVIKIAGGTEEMSPVAPEASVATTRSARQQFDKAVATKTKIFGKTGKETVKLEAQKEAGNAIRAELAMEYPDVAKINKEVSLWLDVQNVVGETITRTSSQATPLGERIVTAGGLAGGMATGGLGTAVAYGAALKGVSKLINSTAWRTVAAVEKNRLADLLASGKMAEATVFASKLMTGGRLSVQAAQLPGTDARPGGLGKK